MRKVPEDSINAIRQIAATLIRRCPDIPVHRSVDYISRPPSLFSSMLFSDEDARVNSRPPDEGISFALNRFRDSRDRRSETIVDPRRALALIFENSQVFDSVSNRRALVQAIQQSVTDLAAIETEVDLHILRPYDAKFFEGRDTSRAVRLAEREYKRYRAHAVSALAEAVRRYGENCRTPLGRNINRLRNECGWTFEVLAEKVDLDRRVVIGHVNEGKGARPGTLKQYATAFSDELNRQVTVQELQS